MEQVKSLWNLLEIEAYPRYQAANEEDRKKIIKETAKAQSIIFKKFLNYKSNG